MSDRNTGHPPRGFLHRALSECLLRVLQRGRNPVYGEPCAEAFRRSLGDPAVNFALNFRGAPARRLHEMGSYTEGTIVGAALLVSIPLGQYDAQRLINLGSNRWAFRGRLGASQRVNRWTIEPMGELWAFTETPDAFGGTSIRQNPILAIQSNVIYQFRRGFWLAAGFGYGEGGRTEVDSEKKDTQQINERFGLTLVYPIGSRYSLKLAYLNSLSTRIGADFDKVSAVWQMRWGGGI